LLLYDKQIIHCGVVRHVRLESLMKSLSSGLTLLLVPRTRNKLGDRSFLAAGPRLWNDLPPGLRRPGLSFDSFRRSLKTSLWRLKRLVILSTY